MYEIQDVLERCKKIVDLDIEKILLIGITYDDKVYFDKYVGVGNNKECYFNSSVFLRVIKNKLCNKVIIAHNHPIDKPEPSIPDDRLTKALRECEDEFGYTLVDHIIVAKEYPDLYYSYKEHNFEYTEL